METEGPGGREELQLAGLIQRETVVLAALVAITVTVFFVTRMTAAHERAAARRSAATWFEVGQRALARGDTDAAIAGFRHAVLDETDNVRYELTLADALVGAGRTDEARRILLRRRVSSPENGHINLALARLAAARGDIGDATRYYHNALYGVWEDARVIDPRIEREVRRELIRLLLEHHRSGEALSHLLLLEQDLPDEAEAHVEAGRLFLEAGSPSNALNHFTRAIDLQASNLPALGGAVQAAFALGDYARAGRFLSTLRKSGELPQALTAVAPVVDAILTGDPLAPRLNSSERARRLIAGLDRAIARATACEARLPGSVPPDVVREAAVWRSKITPRAIRLDPDLSVSAFDLISRLEERSNTCTDAESFDRALLLLGRKYADNSK